MSKSGLEQAKPGLTAKPETNRKTALLESASCEMRVEQMETRGAGAMRVSELNYWRLFESARDGILILDIDG